MIAYQLPVIAREAVLPRGRCIESMVTAVIEVRTVTGRDAVLLENYGGILVFYGIRFT